MLDNELEKQLYILGKNFCDYMMESPNDDFDYYEELNKFIEENASNELKQYMNEMEEAREEARKQGIILD